METTCIACGAQLDCNPGPDCWCAQLPFTPMPEAPAGCYCPACLRRQIAGDTQPGKTAGDERSEK